MEILAVLERRGEEKRGKGSRMKGKFRVTKSLARPNQLNSASLAPNPANDLAVPFRMPVSVKIHPFRDKQAELAKACDGSG